MKKVCMLTNDVETTSIYFNALRDETGKLVLDQGMPRLLELYEKYRVKSTFFFTGYIAEKFPQIVKMILKAGHEVGSHGYSHKIKNAFDVLTYQKQVEHLKKSKNILEDISGEEVISFRAPALRVKPETAGALIECGFKIDCSVASQRFDFLLSHSALNKLRWLYAPRLPYYCEPRDLFKKGNSELMEIPISAFIMPHIGTTMRLFPGITKIQSRFFAWENKLNNKPIVFLIHPNEFIEEKSGKRIIDRRDRSFASHLVRDILRSKMKIKNLGLPAVSLYDEIISYYSDKSFRFITMKEYYNEKRKDDGI